MIAIIDYGMGNVASVKKAITKIGLKATITDEHSTIAQADGLILPGVGSYHKAMKNLREKNLVDLIRAEALDKKKTILGICLGMQLLSTRGYEDELTTGLNLIPGTVKKITAKHLPIPHIGWNDINVKQSDHYFSSIVDFNFYFVHSFYFDVDDTSNLLATTTYEHPLTAAVVSQNIIGTQFHPEKSQESGLRFLRNIFTKDEVC